MDETDYTSIKIKKSTQQALKQCDGSYDCSIDGMLKSKPNVVSDETRKQILEKFCVDEDADLNDILVSYLVEEREKRVANLGASAKRILERTGNTIEQAEVVQEIVDLAKKSPGAAMGLMIELHVDAIARLKKEFKNEK